MNKGYDIETVKKEAELLYNVGEARLGTDESEFIRILCSKSYAELNAIFALYKKKYGHGFDEALQKELSGHFLLGSFTLL